MYLLHPTTACVYLLVIMQNNLSNVIYSGRTFQWTCIGSKHILFLRWQRCIEKTLTTDKGKWGMKIHRGAIGCVLVSRWATTNRWWHDKGTWLWQLTERHKDENQEQLDRTPPEMMVSWCGTMLEIKFQNKMYVYKRDWSTVDRHIDKKKKKKNRSWATRAVNIIRLTKIKIYL